MALVSRALAALLLLPFLWFFTAPARAALTIEIFGGAANPIPVALVPFGQGSGQPQGLTEIVAADLKRSGLFRVVDTPAKHQPHEPADVDWGVFRDRGADAIVIGRVLTLPDGKLEVRFRLMDAVKRNQLTGVSYTIGTAQWRSTAHRIADVVFEKLTGVPGGFTSRIAYVAKEGKRYQLKVADSDGFEVATVFSSVEPIISPTWSPDGTQLTYVSFEAKKPIVYSQDLQSGERTRVAAFRGSNSAPAWAPDGKRLAVVISNETGSQIHLLDADGSNLVRLSKNGGIDTEPTFSPDGKSIFFTSDRGGSPQIYRMPANGGDAQRLTFDGSYNVSPALSPDGKRFAFVRREGGRFNIAVQEIDNGQVTVLTDTRRDESPSFAPNGRSIVYATSERGRGVLTIVSTDGKTRSRISDSAADIREPAWGPILK